jgi:hypothetical protein
MIAPVVVFAFIYSPNPDRALVWQEAESDAVVAVTVSVINIVTRAVSPLASDEIIVSRGIMCGLRFGA